jgi:cytochrome c oxidase subunit III
MEIGTVETIDEVDGLRKPRSRFTSSSSSTGSGSGSGGNGGDGPDGDGPQGSDFPVRDEEQSGYVDKSKYIAWFLLLAVGMTFAGLLGAYLLIATNRAAEWKPFDLPVQVWFSTAIILFSSITYSLAKRAVDADEFRPARKWLIVTTVLGALFVSSQMVLWLELVGRGLYMQGNPYAGFFYILTAAHLVHVAGGIVALSAILLRSWYPSRSEAESLRRHDLARSVGWYWHFMGGLWVVLFLMLGFWK